MTTPIALLISDVDGTLLTRDKTLTPRAIAAVRRLRTAGIGFTVTSSRPIVGMRFLVEPLELDLPIGAFNGGAIVDPAMNPIEQHAIPVDAARAALEVLKQHGVDAWLFTADTWLVQDSGGAYVAHEQRTIRAAPVTVDDFAPHLAKASKIVGASPDPALLVRCEAAMQRALGARATAIRSQSYYLDITPPGCSKGTFVRAMSRHLGIPASAIATIGDMENDLAMFAASGMSIAMGNAGDDIKRRASHVTASNEDDGFARAVDMILGRNGSS